MWSIRWIQEEEGLVQMKSFVLVAVLAVGMATGAMAAPIGVWSTGVCAGLNVAGCTPNTVLGFGVQDLNYTFSGFSTTNRTESAISTYVPDAVGASRWLTPGTTAAGTFATGTYTVTTTFNLAGFNASTLSLFLDIAADNIVVAALKRHHHPVMQYRRRCVLLGPSPPITASRLAERQWLG
jgi:hypothetical protein